MIATLPIQRSSNILLEVGYSKINTISLEKKEDDFILKEIKKIFNDYNSSTNNESEFFINDIKKLFEIQSELNSNISEVRTRLMSFDSSSSNNINNSARKDSDDSSNTNNTNMINLDNSNIGHKDNIAKFPFKKRKYINTIKHIYNTIITKISSFNIHSNNNYNKPICIISFKRDLLLKHISVYFKDIYFKNEKFMKLVKLYNISIVKPFLESPNISHDTTYEINRYLNYPSKIKNYSSCKHFTPRIFLKQDLSFFNYPKLNISHSYCKDLRSYYTQNKPLLTHNLPLHKDKRIPFCQLNTYIEFNCELIKPTTRTFGIIAVCDNYLMFYDIPYVMSINNMDFNFFFGSDPNDYDTKTKEVLIAFNDIEEIMKKRFLYMDKAVDVHLKNGKSYFFNFFKKDTYKEFIECVEKVLPKDVDIIKNPEETFKERKYTFKWRQQEINNFEYLLLVNKYSGRSFNEMNQYPVFPWVLLMLPMKNEFDILFETNEIKDKKIKMKKLPKEEKLKPRFFLRFLRTPISTQSRKAYDESLQAFLISKEDSKNPSHFRLHYSTWAYVILYLVRLAPFTQAQIKFQNNKFDSPNRQFSSFEELFKVLTLNTDNRELLPDMFMNFEYFYNLNRNLFGYRHNDNKLINNILIPPRFKSPCDFVLNMRLILNSEKVLTNISYWIDNIFGYYQGTKEESRINLFNKYSYYVDLERKYNKYKKQGKEDNEIYTSLLSKKVRILNFGQTPSQLFKSKHYKWIKTDSETQKKEDEINEIDWLVNQGGLCKQYSNDGKCEVIYLDVTSKQDKFYVLKKKRKNAFTSYEIEIFCNYEDNKKPLILPIKHIKLYRKNITSSSSSKTHPERKSYCFMLQPKYILFEVHNGKFFIIGRNYDNCIIIYSDEELPLKSNPNKCSNIIHEIFTGSFVSCLYKISDTSFFSGHKNGRVFEWEITYNEVKIKKNTFFSKTTRTIPSIDSITIKRNILAHDNAMITAIHYNSVHNVLVTAGDDGNIYIRKYYDFELLNVISTNRGNELFFNDVMISNYDLIYAQYTSKRNVGGNYLIGFSINGLKFSDYVDDNKNMKNIYSIQSLHNGKVLLCSGTSKLTILDGGVLTKENEYKLIDKGVINYFLYLEEKNLLYIINDTGEVSRITDDNFKKNYIDYNKIQLDGPDKIMDQSDFGY